MEQRYKPIVLQEYFNVMLYRDLVERYAIGDVAVLKYLVKRMVTSFTKEFSVNKLFNDLKSRGFSIGKDSLYRMVDQISSVYMVMPVSRFDPAVVKREMSNRKVYLFDNGLAPSLDFSVSTDRGRLLENLVFTHLRTMTHEVCFLKNGWECDLVAFRLNKPTLLVQVTAQLNRENRERELKGLMKAREKFEDSEALLLVGELPGTGVEVPDWVQVHEIPEWLLWE